MHERILFVDDDEHILAAYQRTLRKNYQLETALGGEIGLAILSKGDAFAVVVSDMRMPGMSGVEFLVRARALVPDTVRMMLTGQADFQAAIDAVNEGNIFRFLTKPCPAEALAQALEAGLAQYRLVLAERELLEKTLNGSIKLLTDILALANPEAFSRADRLKRYIRHLTKELCLAEQWPFELAAVFSQIGCITIPLDTLKKHDAGQSLTAAEKGMIDNLPKVSSELLGNIPRLEGVASMIAGLQDRGTPLSDSPDHSQTALGTRLLRAATSYDEAVCCRGLSHQEAIAGLKAQNLDPQLLAAFDSMYERADTAWTRTKTSIFDLATGMILDEDVQTKKGLLLVAKGQSVSETLMKSLSNYLTRREIEEHLFVLTPQNR